MRSKCKSSQVRRKSDGRCLKRSSPAGKRVIAARKASRSRSRSSSRHRAPKQELRCQQIKQNGKQCRLAKAGNCGMYCHVHAQSYNPLTRDCVDGNGFVYKTYADDYSLL